MHYRISLHFLHLWRLFVWRFCQQCDRCITLHTSCDLSHAFSRDFHCPLYTIFLEYQLVPDKGQPGVINTLNTCIMIVLALKSLSKECWIDAGYFLTYVISHETRWKIALSVIGCGVQVTFQVISKSWYQNISRKLLANKDMVQHYNNHCVWWPKMP